MMKVNKFLMGGLSALLLSAASCSNEPLVPGTQDQPLKSDQSFFIPISVNGYMNDGTRAGELDDYGNGGYKPNEEPNFDKGKDSENTAQTVYLVFYDANGNRVSATQARKDGSGLGDAYTGTTENPLPNSQNSIYSGVVQVDVKGGNKLPAYVLAFVNPVSNTEDIFEKGADFKTLAQVEKLTRNDFISTSNYFAMSNSVYYGDDEITGAPNARIMATPIVSSKLFFTEAEAKKAVEKGEGSTVDIYVERYAGKINFSVTNDPNQISTLKIKDSQNPGTEIELTFVPEYWAVNAVEEKSYVTKNFFGKTSTGTFDFQKPISYEALNDKLKWYWNSPDNHRSYWGQSPAYYIARYPRVSDDIIDQDGYDKTTKPKGNYELRYYSYTEMAKEADKTATNKFAQKVPNDGTETTIYTRENTVSGDALKDANSDPLASPKAAIASVVMVGSYQVDGEPVTGGKTFYVTGNGDDADPYIYYTETNMYDHFLNNSLPLASDDKGAKIDLTKNEYKNQFTIEHPKKESRGNLVLDSRWVTLQIKAEALNDANPIYAKVGDDWVKVTKGDDKNPGNVYEINYQILLQGGTARGFNGGKAYFNIPIQHLGYYRTDNENSEIKNGANNPSFKWDKAKSGDFGVVRNHAYTINVKKIEGLANAIPQPDVPIVPPTDPEKYYIGARLIVLNWAIVPPQSVEL